MGGIKEKVLAAHRAGIKNVLLPVDNRKDISDIPENVKRKLQFLFVEHMDEVLELALVKGKRKRGVLPGILKREEAGPSLDDAVMQH